LVYLVDDIEAIVLEQHCPGSISTTMVMTGLCVLLCATHKLILMHISFTLTQLPWWPHAVLLCSLDSLGGSMLSYPTAALHALTCGEGYHAYDSIISKVMAYPLCVMTFTKAECAKIQATYMSTTLQKMGFIGTTKHALVFGPEEYGRLGITDIWMEQGIQHVSLLLRHLRNGAEARMLLTLGIEWMVLMIGCLEEIFSYHQQDSEVHTPELALVHVGVPQQY
jgi:hypothetical protein